MKREREFLILKGDFERKSVRKKNAPRERMLASGLGVYRFVKIGEISREQHQLVRLATLLKQRGGNGCNREPSPTHAGGHANHPQ